jgi:hypothetical protein
MSHLANLNHLFPVLRIGVSNMNAFKMAVSAVFLSYVTSAVAMNIEGVYAISTREACEGEQIDSVIILTDSSGAAHAMLSSKRFSILYQNHALTIGANGHLAGSTIESSLEAATLDANLSGDLATITGTVHSVRCDLPWAFVAEREALPVGGALLPLDHSPQVNDFLGGFNTSLGTTAGTLRFTRLADGRVFGAYKSAATDATTITFAAPAFDFTNRSVDLFLNNADGLRLKWHLNFGIRAGKLTLQGYGINTTGMVYPITAIKD